ncbi:uncharacterized protein F4812DRAFT_471262 [Daldinia caldariorum]|uniref:uncharacterized protein n=1 Tax=Daldinia caldariorum TaxID=326644 RepID=UPI002008E457|nr:uncharacterized protein F4812DRAFT_471262 [Daldinia caldariorum]KAI1467924.1 hypothetical protein F4812DRAFT_471262 [Daldinia caldariorum]
MESKTNMSLRPSSSTPSLKAAKKRPVSAHSTGSKSYRHALLKSEDVEEQLTRDLPIPPVLTKGSVELTKSKVTMKQELSSVLIPTRKSSNADLESQAQAIPALDEKRRPGVVCIDPTIHPAGKHAEIHHPGLIVGADFCDAGLAVERDSPIRTPPSKPASELSDPILTGWVRRDLSGGDICEDMVDVSEHIHNNHTHATKVRPAVGLPFTNEKHYGHFHMSKVKPAFEEAEQKKVIHQSKVSTQKDPITEEPYVPEQIHHGHSLAPKIRMPQNTPRARTHRSEPHEGHIGVQKVQPYHEPASATFRTEENSTPRLSVKKNAQQIQDLEKSTPYWGFLRGFGSQEGEKAEVNSELMDNPISQAENREAFPISSSGPIDKSIGAPYIEHHPSLSASQYSASPKSFDNASKAVARLTESSGNQENIRYTNASISSLGKYFSNSPSQDRTALSRHGQDVEVQTSSVSPTSFAQPTGGDKDTTEQSILPEGIDAGRAAAWFRQFLGYEESSPSNLTQLPEKVHPRHANHDDYPDDNDDVLISRATTFSGKTSKEAGTIDTAVHNLEKLLSEALSLANEATENDHCGHGDDGELISRLKDTTGAFESHPILSDTPEIQGRDLTKNSHRHTISDVPPDTAVDTAGEKANDPDTSSKSEREEGELEPDIRSGNVTRSNIQHGSNTRGVRKSRHKHRASGEVRPQVYGGNYALPMPPPGNELKRRYLSPMPQAYEEDEPTGVIKPHTKGVPNSREVREYIRVFHQPPITLRNSSKNLSEDSLGIEGYHRRAATISEGCRKDADVYSLNETISSNQNGLPSKVGRVRRKTARRKIHELRNISLRKRSHVSIRDGQRFSLAKSVKRQPIIARDWSPIRKRFVASVACISTALIGVLVGIYAGLVPSIQYFIADFHHYSIIGNVVLYLGMALTTFFCWPLPLLHGRKPYILCSLCIAMPLLFPQAVAVSIPRSPYTSIWRWALLLPRAIMGCALGFASMNFHSILTDLFGASLMSSNPHQEVVDQYDVRRHGGGLGIWLGVWTWCFIGSLGVGFLVGALVIDTLKPSWGLYISIMLIAVVLLLNVLCPEVRRSAWRRSVAEVRTPLGVSRRVARGEIMMHRVKDGPKWWGQEMYHGVALSLEMLRQPGFVVMAVYSAWIYAQVVLVMVLLGSLTSRNYHFRSPYVGATVSSVAVGALAAVPFQKANLFSRSRWTGPPTNDMTFDRSVTWTSHLVRRAIFIIVLPIAGILYTIVSSGPPIHLAFPCSLAAIIGFLSCLAIAECNGILMETWDCSDLQPGMTGRTRLGKDGIKRTNYSSFPRVTAGWNIIHSIGFILAAGATGIGGIVTRSLGQRAATGVVASILFLHSLLLLAVFARFRRVQIIPNSKSLEMERWTEERRDSLRRRASAIAAAKANGVKDVSEITEEVELGSLTRWSEIRKKNRLIDKGIHLNRQTVNLARDEIDRRRHEMIGDIHQGAEIIGDIVRKASKRSKRSRGSEHDDTSRDDPDDIGPLGPPGAGLEHQHASLPREVYVERECVMGQAVLEEAEASSLDDESDNESDDDHEWIPMDDHSSHMISKVQPYSDFKKKNLRGSESNTGDCVIEMDATQGEHISHTEPKVRPAEPGGSEQRGEDKSEIKPGKAELEIIAQQHGGHMFASKVKSASMEFEDVGLGGKSSRRNSKTTKQD